MEKLASSLRNLPFFSGLEDGDLRDVFSLGKEKTFSKGDIVFSEGDPAAAIYIVKEGRVKVYKLSPEGKEQILHFVGSGETFGGAPIFRSKGGYPAFAECMSDCRLIAIPRESLRKLISENPQIALKILESFSNYLNVLVSLVEDLSLRDVPRRLARFLLGLAIERGKPVSQGILIDTKLTKEEIASRLGTVREVVSRTLSQFQAKGLIKTDGKSIIILSREKLQQI
jgi:CRP/FNR family transcriptional regulator